MFIIGEAIVDRSVANARFACDLGQCKGACCTLSGGRGAPLEDSELDDLRKAYKGARKYIPDSHLKVIERDGFFEGVPGSFATTCVENRACVFVYYEDGIARCAIERAYLNGESAWRKPISCHLFPIRVTTQIGTHVKYEQIAECAAGRARGSETGVPLADFLRDALIRKFGEEWYEQFHESCAMKQKA